MQEYYLVLLVFLGALALFDLFVGVSNDAVNFLNSALGCRIASFRTTMWVAAAGVMLGATFSSGDDGNRPKRRLSSADVQLQRNHGDLFCRDGG